MRRRRRSSGCLALGCLAAVGAAACLWAGLALPASVASLGEPAAQLSGFDRAMLATYLILHQRDLTAPAGPEDLFATLEVEPGQDASTVADELASLGVLRDPELFSRYLRYRGLDTGIEAGSYQVNGSMSPRDLAELLQRALASRYSLTIPEGWRREQVAEALGELGLGFGAADFFTASQSAPSPSIGAPPGVTDVEGFLFPDTYRLDPRMTADDVVALMLENFEDRMSRELLAAFADKGLTPYEAVSLASIVERESALAAERPLIASVFFNRLALGIPLQADPTVQYALGRQPDGSWWKAPLTEADLRFESPYNTYLHPGLPPGPIANPGLDSLRAVANPTPSMYLFFRAACDGSGGHVFAATFEEHVKNACP